ncbi:MAG TPA: nuclear transport factor 2 family protein [Duganella sp.]|jgi:ketosteroid isomerase-like protein
MPAPTPNRPALPLRPAPRLDALLLAAVLSIAMGNACAVPDGADAELVALINRHVEAQRAFDQPALRAITADNYIEISPLGEVDSREKMLSFYAADKRREAPAIQIDEPSVRTFDQSATIIARLTYNIGTEGQARSVAMRASYVARKLEGKWQLISSQYTPIRPPKP